MERNNLVNIFIVFIVKIAEQQLQIQLIINTIKFKLCVEDFFFYGI